MSPARRPVFLERQTYRRRRIMDAARVLPVAGFVLILLPVLWSRGDGTVIAGEALYLFALWFVLVLAAAALARPLRAALEREANVGAVPPLPAPGDAPSGQGATQPDEPATTLSQRPEPPA